MKNSTFSTTLDRVAPWDSGVPKINASRLFGAGVNSPFFLPIPTIGERLIEFSAEGLPRGLEIGASSGIISGSVSKELETTVLVTARNRHGEDSIEIRIVIGGRLALTPPMGWNSWNCWGEKVDTEKIKACADAMVSSGLAAHGFSYVNIDDGWQGDRGGSSNALQANNKFANMKSLCDYVHGRALRIGIYSTPWVKSYALYSGGSIGNPVGEVSTDNLEKGYHFGDVPCEKEDAKQWAEWGFDYLKYDWYPNDIKSVKRMKDALLASGRDIIYGLSNRAGFENASEYVELANCWRTTMDIEDEWVNMTDIGFSQDRWTPYGGPGHWNDPDMLVVGKLGWGDVRDNRLTHDEQVTHITLWSILAAPLLIGCDLTQLDEFTIRLLCNDEVLAINQDPLGRQGHCVSEVRRVDDNGQSISHQAIYKRLLYDGTVAVGLFNRGPEPEVIEVNWSDLKLEGPRAVRDVWSRNDLGIFSEKFSIGVPSHGAQFVRIGR
jgi:alpha-galactosidase